MKRTLNIFFVFIFVMAVSARASASVDTVNSASSVSVSNPVTVTDGGRMNLSSGQSIILKPGTRVVAGGYLRATVFTDENSKHQKLLVNQAKKSKKPVKKEKSGEPAVIIETSNAISPFVKNSGRSFGKGANNNEDLIAQISETTGISPEQNKKPVASSETHSSFKSTRCKNFTSFSFIPLSQNRETVKVLRL